MFGEVEIAIRGGGGVTEVVFEHFSGRGLFDEMAVTKQKGARAQLFYGLHVVAYEEYCSSRSRDVAHLPETLFLKVCVAYGEDLVDEQDFWL